MNKIQKQEVVEAITNRLNASANFYLADFTGISVKGMTDLRRKFRAQGAEFVVAKNTLFARAFEQVSITGLDEQLSGPTGLVFVGPDPVGAAKVIADFQKAEENKPTVKAGLVDGQTVGPEAVKRLADLPTKPELLSMLAGVLQAPMSGFVGALDGLLYQFVGSLEALREKQQSEAS
jgi:large subunit ribosomal protein L10